MSKRKPTPDIMSSLLGGTPGGPPAEEPASGAGVPARQNTIKPEGKKASKPAGQHASRSPSGPGEGGTGEKVKVTFYVSQDVANRLEEGWMRLRVLASKETRTSISKSGIVERAVEDALDELERKGEKSRLGRSLLG